MLYRSCLLLLTVLLPSLLVSGQRVGMAADNQPLRVTLGQQQIVMRLGHADLSHFPDQPISVLNRQPLTFLMVCGNATFLLSGPSWQTANRIGGKVLEPGGQGTFDNGYAGIGGVHVTRNGIFGFYHAEDHEGKDSEIARQRGQVAGGMFSVGCAVSQDGGRSFQKRGQVLTSRHPFQQGKECGGLGDITICLDKSRKYLLAYYADFSRGQGQGIQIAAARCPIESNGLPGSWRKFHDGDFSQPGLGGDESYVLSVHDRQADAYSPCVVYSAELNRYLMVFCYVDYRETDGVSRFEARESGLYLADSPDGVNWSEPKKLFTHSTLLIPGSAGVQHPTLVLTAGRGKRVSGLLLYGFTPDWGKSPHHLAGRTISIVGT